MAFKCRTLKVNSNAHLEQRKRTIEGFNTFSLELSSRSLKLKVNDLRRTLTVTIPGDSRGVYITGGRAEPTAGLNVCGEE
jgi:hypothetical protein